MDVFVARQPIFRRDRQLYGYELLYRKSGNNFFEGEDDTLSTAEVISNSFLVFGFNELTDGTRGFINFPAELLLRDIPLVLPKENVVIELLERADITDELFLALEQYKAKGYMLALDDFALDMDDEHAARLLELADIVKIEFPNIPVETQRALLKRYKSKKMFLAERIETKEEFELAAEMGYSLFQGYFFSRPVIVNAKEIESFKSNTGRILEELSKKEPDIGLISGIFVQDPGLSYKLLRLVNSAHFGMRRPIESIRQAIMLVGTDELRIWLHLIFLKSLQTKENRELIKQSVIRAKMLSLLLQSCPAYGSDCFFVGIFSALDVILNRGMDHALDGLPLSPLVRDTLLKRETPISPFLALILAQEQAQWDTLDRLLEVTGVTKHACMSAYIEALRWQQGLPI